MKIKEYCEKKLSSPLRQVTQGETIEAVATREVDEKTGFLHSRSAKVQNLKEGKTSPVFRSGEEAVR